MASSAVFEEHATRYDEWFSKNQRAYDAELRAVAALLPARNLGVEIGVGTGRFASRLGITIGLEPSGRMRAMAIARGIRVVAGVAEHLPFAPETFGFALMATTLCFLDDARQAFLEVRRILRPAGSLVVAFVDRDSPLGRLYAASRDKSVFYRNATFYTTAEVLDVMEFAGFSKFAWRQTLFRRIEETLADEPVLPGWGMGSFVVVRGERSQ